MNKSNQKGFTIIEVVLVLAIAALIFLMVFIALPAVRENQRDTARRTDVTSVAAGVNNYTSNNRGSAFPNTSQLESYVENISDNISSVVVRPTRVGNVAVDDGVAAVYPRTKCGSVNTEGRVVLERGTERQFTVITRLESGNNSGFCLDS